MRVCVLSDTLTDKAVKGGHVCVCVCVLTDTLTDKAMKGKAWDASYL